MVSSNNSTRPASTTAGDDFAEGLVRLAGWVLLASARLVWWAILFPMFTLPLAVSMYVACTHGRRDGVLTAGVFLLGLVLWRAVWPASFRAAVTGRIRARWRRWARYTKSWAARCALHGLTATLDSQTLVPRLVKVRIGAGADVLTVRMLVGQTLTDWSGQADALAHTYGARSVTVTSPARGTVVMRLNYRDRLAIPIPLPAAEAGAVTDLHAVPIGVTEAGDVWQVPVIGRHILIAGATGAGKGSVLWSILAGVAPAIPDGLVAVWVVDPKGGMEFGAGAALFSRFAYDTGENTLTLLRDAAAILTDRANRLRGTSRQHTTTAQEPLILLAIDELAALTAYMTDRATRVEVEQLLGLILSQGRAVGVSVVACVQDPSKEVLALRQLFPTRIGLRLSEATQVGMVLGLSARERGALCDQIPDSQPGVGYMAEDGTATLTRGRAFHVTDTDIDHLAATFTPPASSPATPVADPGL